MNGWMVLRAEWAAVALLLGRETITRLETEAIFKALSDRTRQRALSVLRRHELNVSELVEVLDQPQSTVSRHLKVLRDAGLIRDRREGNSVSYSAQGLGGQNGQSALADRLLGWVDEQGVDAVTAPRLKQVLLRRRDMSRRFFDRVGRRWDTLREESFGNRFHLEALWELLPAEWVVADLGTGTGYLLPPLSRHFHRVVAVEPVENMLEVARQRRDDHGLRNVELLRGELEHLPIPSASIDLAVAMLVLHHVPEPGAALAEVDRVLKPQGRVLIVEQALHQQPSFQERMQDRRSGFDPQEWQRLLASVGLVEIRTRPLVSVERAPDAPELFVVTARKPAADVEDPRNA